MDHFKTLDKLKRWGIGYIDMKKAFAAIR